MSGPRPLHRRLLDRIEMGAARLVQAISLALPGEAWAQSAGAVIGPLWPGLVKRVADNLALVRPGASRAEARALAQIVAPQLRGGFARAEDGHARGTQTVGEAVDQRRFGADHDEANRLRPHEIDHRGVIRRVEGDARRMGCNAGVAWRGVERIEGRRLRQFPRQSVFAAA